MIFFKWVSILTVTGLLVILLPRALTALIMISRSYSVASAPQRRVAIVFGAGLQRDGSPTTVLRDRVATAADLYFAGKIEKLLLSGDNRFVEYDEPGAMRAYALNLGVPDEAIVLDYAGRRTYDTCYRAREIFGVKEALLVTQKFHLPRALYICGALGLQAEGIPADNHIYRRRAVLFWNLRELPATLIALVEVHITHPVPVLGTPEPIFPAEASIHES